MNKTFCGKYECGKVLGEGAYSQVREATDPATGKKCALKMFKASGEEAKSDMYEAEILQTLNHRNIIKMIECCPDGELKRENRTKKVSYIATELAEHGTLFQYLTASKNFSEITARTIFSQIVEAFEYMHSEGIWHRDIKSENIFFDSDYNIKIGDFGFATTNTVESGRKGTCGYMAPEIHTKSDYNCKSVDIFALGVLLFTMVIGKYPFVSATEKDWKYKLIHLNKPDLFWRTSTRNKDMLNLLTPEFKDMLNIMLSPYPCERPTISELRQMDWMKGKIYTQEALSTEFASVDVRKTEEEDFVIYH